MSEENRFQNEASQSNETRSKQQNNIELQKKKNVRTIITVVLAAQIILAIIAGAFFFRAGYNNAKTNTSNNIRKKAYDTVYDITEEANHTSNRATIELSGIKEKANLEVLQISTSYLYISDDADQAKNLTIWYKIPGTGTFTVDLQATEFIVDNERHHVLVKVPAPSITKFREERAEQINYQDDRIIFHGSIGEGEGIARKMLYKAHIEMMKSLESNNEYVAAAKVSAQKLITNVIKALNPLVRDLTVTVEFSENT